jgi:hypothetical protein
VAGFWRPRRQAESARPGGDGDEALNPASGTDDPELAAQLAHLEEIERRAEQLYVGASAGGGEGQTVAVTMPEEAWPEAIPPIPDAALSGGDPAPVLRWLETALAVLSARASRNRDELQRLSSQWVHISRNLTRFRAEEVAAVVESEARVRERVAADETVCHLIRLIHGYLSDAQQRPDSVALAAGDVDMLRRLLDDAAADRMRARQTVQGGVIEMLSGLALDIEVLQRQAERQPEGMSEALRGLQDRLAGVVDDLRAQPGAEPVVPRDGEPLASLLRRTLDAYQPRIPGDLICSGGEPADPEVCAAVVWIVREFLDGTTGSGGRDLRVDLTTGEGGVVLRLSATAPASTLDGGWLLRCRARASIAGGAVAAEPGGGDAGTVAVEVRFPGGASEQPHELYGTPV